MRPMTLAEVLQKYRPHRGLTAESLIDKLSAAPGADVWRLDLTDEEQKMLGLVLTEDSVPPTQIEVELAVAALSAKHLRTHERVLTEEICRAEASGGTEAVTDFLRLKQVVRRGLDGLED